jgi:MFS family permease
MKGPGSGNRLVAAISLLGIGWYFAASIVGGILAGLLLDSWLGTRPLLTLAGIFAGLLVAFWGGYRMLLRVTSRRNEH